MEGNSTNTTEFKKFLEKVLLEVKCEYRGSKRAVLIMDNHGAHISKKNRQFLEREFFPVFLPAHSSPFNSIERVWSAAKHNFALLSLHNHEEMKKQEFTKMVLKACKSISRQSITSLCHSNREHILKFLISR